MPVHGASVKRLGVGQGGLPIPLPTTTINAVKGKSLYTNFLVGGVDTTFLVDSGAEISILPEGHESLASNTELLQARMRPVLVDGSELPVLGVVESSVVINGQKVGVEFYVVKANISPILGSDVMKGFSWVRLDFGNQEVEFGPRVMVRSSSSGSETVAPKVCRLVLSEDVMVPSNHEVIVKALLQSSSPAQLEGLEGQSYLFESNLLGNTVSVARVLGRVTEGTFPVRICNPLPSPVQLRKNKSLGELTAVDEPVVAVVGEQDDLTDLMSSDASQKEEEILEDLVNGAEVSGENRILLREFLYRNKEVFSLSGELGRYRDMPFSIDTGDARPIRQMPRRVPHHLKAEVDKQLDEMLRQGVIEPSYSPWASPICLVRKKDGGLRFCVDYRKLNSVTKADAFPIPHMGDCLNTLGGSKIFSALDLASGYWQCEMDKESSEKAAITTHRGLFQPTVLPFGVKGGVAHFSRIMSALFSSLQWKILLIYLDDLLVYANSFEEHVSRLGVVFDCLRKAGLKLKPSKCKIARKSLKFLGHVVSSEGVSPDPEKLQSVRQFPVPQDVDSLRRFLGLAGYYRDFVPGFADIVQPLNDLTRKGVPYNWTVLCVESFEKVKLLLLGAPVLAYPDFQKEFVLTTDASDIGLGAILSQSVDGRDKPIHYASRPLSKAEKNYCTSEKECLAVVWAAQYFSYFLLGKPFVVRTDHDPLTYLHSVPTPHGRLARWIAWLEQFTYRMEYAPGKSIPHVDALSRAPVIGEVSLPVEVSTSEVQREQQKDRVIGRVVELWRAGRTPGRMESEEIKQLWRVSKDLIFRNGILCVKSQGTGRGTGLQVVLPRSLVQRVLNFAHDEHGHFAKDRTLAAVRAKFFWGSIFRDVENWCQSCLDCQSRSSPMMKPRAPLQFSPIPSRVWQMVALDFLGPLVETSRGNKHILVVTDKLSKYAIALALPDQTAETTALALFYKVFCIYSFPEFLHSDQGRNFESALIKKLCDISGIEKTRTTGYHPQGNGQTERYNRTLLDMLSKSIDQRTQSDWDDWLPLVQFSYNTSIHTCTGIQPFELQFGRESKTLLDLVVSGPSLKSRDKSARECLEKLKTQVGKQIKVAQEMISKNMLKQKASYDQRENFRQYERGELVMLREYACKKGLKPKLMKEKWSGPWKVVCRKSEVTYRIAKGTGKRRRKVVVHHDRLKIYVRRSAELTPTLSTNADGDVEPEIAVEHEGVNEVAHHNEFAHVDWPAGFEDDDEVMDQPVPQPEGLRNGVDQLHPEEGPLPDGDRPYGLRDRRNINIPARYRDS